MIYFELFWSFFQIGLLSIGGGYAAMPMIQDQVVTFNHWISMTEFTDLITISQMTPGSISINSATFVGLRVAGLGGAVVATIGTIVPSFIVVSILGFVYYGYKKISLVHGILEGLRPTVIALIASAGVSILITALFGEAGLSEGNLDIVNLGIFFVALIGLRKYHCDATLVMVLSGVLAVITQLIPFVLKG